MLVTGAISSTASTLNPFSFLGKLTRAAAIGVGAAVGLAVVVLLICCLVPLMVCKRKKKKEDEALLYAPPASREGPGSKRMYHSSWN